MRQQGRAAADDSAGVGGGVADQRIKRNSPNPSTSFDADGDRASQPRHAVQDMHGDRNFGGTTLIFAKAKTIADHLLVTSDSSLNPTTKL